MAKEVTAYVADDGKIYLNREEAEFSDFSCMVSEDVASFLKTGGHDDKDGHIAKLIIKWEMWKVGGLTGWMQQVEGVALPPTPQQAPILVPATPVASKPKKVAPPPEPPKAIKRTVAVVGLLPSNRAAIQGEFGDVFKLSLITADERHKLRGLKEYHKVFVMSKFVAAAHIDILRSIGQEPMIVRGGLNELRDAMTNYFVAVGG